MWGCPANRITLKLYAGCAQGLNCCIGGDQRAFINSQLFLANGADELTGVAVCGWLMWLGFSLLMMAIYPNLSRRYSIEIQAAAGRV
jgi:hypothetical protein